MEERITALEEQLAEMQEAIGALNRRLAHIPQHSPGGPPEGATVIRKARRPGQQGETLVWHGATGWEKQS